MKTLTRFILVFSVAVTAVLFTFAPESTALMASTSVSSLKDTVDFYAVATGSETRNGKTTYTVNGKPATKAEYDKYHNSYIAMGNCKPCYLRTYSIDGKLLNEGDRYTDCRVGYWKQYYPDGNVKTEGHFKTDESGKWNEKKSEKWCEIRHGQWTYYSDSGAVDSTVNYVNNVRVK